MKKNIRHLIDLKKVDTLLEGFNQSTGFVTAIVDLDGNVLSKSGWKSICTEFHRINPETSKRCTISDTELANKMKKSEKYHAYKCLNGLMDVAVPLKINGEHVANLFSGQFFFEKSDLAFFKKQAKEFGFDENKYLDALGKVPVVSEEKVKTAMNFLLNMTEFISDLGIQKLEQEKITQNLRDSEEKLKSIFRVAPAGIGVLYNRTFADVNPRVCEMTGYRIEELVEQSARILYPTQEEYAFVGQEKYKQIAKHGTGSVETRWQRKDGKIIDILLNSTPVDSDDLSKGVTFTALDITERKQAEKFNRESAERAKIQRNLIAQLTFEKSIVNNSIDDALKILTNNLAATMEVDRVSVWMLSEDDKVLQRRMLYDAASGYHSQIEVLNTTDIPSYFAALRKDSQIDADDAQNDSRTKELTDNYLIPLQINSLLDSAIQQNGCLIGVLSAEHRGPIRKWHADEESFLSAIANLAAQLFANRERIKAEEKLRESESRFRKLYEDGATGMVMAGKDFKFLMANPTFCQMTGCREKELKQLTFAQITHPDDRAKDISPAKKMMEGKINVYRTEKRYVKKDGQTFWGQLTVSPIYDSNGQFLYFVGIIVDVTERKQAEVLLKESENKFRNLFQNHVAIKLLIDPENGNIVEANQAAAAFYGWSIEELKKMNIAQINTLPVVAMKKETEKAMALKKTHFEFKHRKADGSLVDVEVFSSSVGIDGKQFLHSIIQDISERKKAQEGLIKHEQLLASVMDTQQELICRFLPDTTLTFVNKAYCTIFGKTEHELLGRKFVELAPESEWEVIYSNLKRLNKENPQITYEVSGFNAEGSVITMEWTDIAIFNENGEVVEFQGIGRDITEKLKALNELIKAKEKAEESDRLKSAFLANMSHEIRTPMNGILGFTDLLLNPDLSSDEKESFIKIVQQSGQRMLNTVTDIVEISKIEAGIVHINEKETDLNESVEELFNFFKPEAEKKGLKLILDNLLPGTEKNITTDRNKFDSILSNLIKNAIKFTESGTVNVGCQSKGSVLEFYIKDTGIGIPKARQEAIFNRFEQADIADTRVFEGSGLGLAIAKSYVEMLGGKIWAESREGKGATFYFTLPAKNNSEKKSIEYAEASSDNKKKKPSFKKLKILIAEDDETSLNYITLIVNEFSTELLEAKTGIEAIELSKKNQDIGLILMDIKMPGMDGYEATRRIREFNKEVIIIAQTAYGLSGDREKVIEAGCNDYISKPIKKAELHALIQKYLGNDYRIERIINDR